MKLIPIRTSAELEEASRLFAQIDSSISFMFVMNQRNALSAYLVKGFDVRGAYFCYKSENKTYIYIAFEKENSTASSLVARLCRENLLSLNERSGEVWIKHENKLTIRQLKQDFLCAGSEYGMTEFVMTRSGFSDIPIPAEITVKGYQALHFREYLSLLDAAMTYHAAADFYSGRADEYRKAFFNGDKNGYFKAFWLDTTLIGLYLRDWQYGDELALLAINAGFQRKGYGACLLHHAANALFTTTEKNSLYLYCMDCNTAAKAFYIKQSMQISGHSYKMTILTSACR